MKRLYFAVMHSLFARVACWLVVVLGLWGSNPVWSQSSVSRCDSSWVLSGSVLNDLGRWVPSSMVVNRSTGAGEFVGNDGEFLIRVCPGDTLVFGAVGYKTVSKAVLPDGSLRWDMRLAPLKVDIGTAEVIAPRTLREIVRDIQALGYKEEDFRVSGVDAFESPITFLYESFSREAQSRRAVAAMENDDRRRALLQELFVKYVDYDIVDLESSEFEAFARFCDPGDSQLKQWSQYEFILYVKQRYQLFRLLPRDLPGDEMEYHKD